MNWEDLRHFLVLPETGSLSAAARRLGVDHTTVARRVGSLEEALSVRLVDGLPRAVLLTQEGRRVAELGQHMEAEARAVLRAAGGMDEAVRDVVRVSAPPGFARAVLTRPPVAFRSNDHATLAEAASAGLGVALLPRYLGDRIRACGRFPARSRGRTAKSGWRFTMTCAGRHGCAR